MNWNGFKGAALRIDDIDIPAIAYQIDVGEDELHAFMDVESLGSGFDKEGRPKLLFEPHVFYRNLTGVERDRAVAAGLAYKSWGEQPYPKDSYPRLVAAMQINETAALKACSVGLTQILMENHAMVDYPTPQEMMLAFMDDESLHLQAAVDYIIATGIDDDMRKIAKLDRPTTPDDCRSIVRVYNGPAYEKNNYHVKFAKAHNKWRGIPDTPFDPISDLKPENVSSLALVGTVQALLRDLGYPEVGEVDNKAGNRTRNAILAFQADNGMELTGAVTDALLVALLHGEKRQEATSRATVTKGDLKAKGDRTVHLADQLGKIAMGVLGASGLGGVVDGTASIKEITDGVVSIKKLADMIAELSPWVLGAGVGVAAMLFASKLVKGQVDAYRNGRAL